MTPFRINHALLYVVAGVTTRAMSGTQLYRNRHWLSTCIKYTTKTFITVLVLRLFPRALHEWIAYLYLSSWITHLCLRRAKRILVPIISERMRQQLSPDGQSDKPPDLLQYMIEDAQGEDLEPERLAHLQLIVNLARIHTPLRQLLTQSATSVSIRNTPTSCAEKSRKCFDKTVDGRRARTRSFTSSTAC